MLGKGSGIPLKGAEGGHEVGLDLQPGVLRQAFLERNVVQDAPGPVGCQPGHLPRTMTAHLPLTLQTTQLSEAWPS